MTDDLSSKGADCPPIVSRWCSFCGRPNADPAVLVMVVSSVAAICDECAAIATRIAVDARIAAVDRSALSLARGHTPGDTNG